MAISREVMCETEIAGQIQTQNIFPYTDTWFLLLGVTALGVIMKSMSLFNSQLKIYSEYGREGILVYMKVH